MSAIAWPIANATAALRTAATVARRQPAWRSPRAARKTIASVAANSASEALT